MAQSSYQKITLTSNVTLSWPFSFEGGTTIADINDISVPQVQIACYAATTGNLVALYNNGTAGVGATLTNNGEPSVFIIDGVSPTVGSRVLVKDQTTFSNWHGIYTVTVAGDTGILWVLTRATDYDTPTKMKLGDTVPVTNGTTNANTRWVQTANIVSVGISSPIYSIRNNGWAITLPDATLASPGQNIIFNNISNSTFQIMLNDGVTVLATIAASQVYYLYLTDVTTPNGIWIPTPFGGGISAINAIEAKTTGKTLTITNGTLTPPGGTITFETTDSISNLVSNVSAKGILVLTGVNPSTYNTRSLVGGDNIVVTNEDGLSGNPTVALSPTLGKITSIEVGDLQLSGNVVTTNVTNGTVQITSLGTGKVNINGTQIDTSGDLTHGTLKLSSNIITSTATNGAVQVNSIGTGKVSINNIQIDTSSNITGVNDLTLGGSLSLAGSFTAGSFSSATTPKVIFNFTDTSVPVGNTVVQLSQYNVASVTGSNGTYIITFLTPLTSGGVPSSNYAISFALGSNGGTPNANHVYWTLKTPSTLTIAIIDAGGVLVPNVPYGVSGAIYLPT